MNLAYPLSSDIIALSFVSVGLMVLLPLIIAVLAGRRLGVGPRYWLYGALVFFVSQMVLRIPLVTGLQVALAPALTDSGAARLAFAAMLALTAGLFEGVGRYLGYRWLMARQEKTWARGVMYGLGHGGFEAAVLIAGLALAQLIPFMTLTTEAAATLPAEVQAQLAAGAATINGLPTWAHLAGAYERLWALAFHVAMSVVVLQAFLRGDMRWLWYAVGAHAALDFIVPTLLPMLAEGLGLGAGGRILLSEAGITLFGLAGLWLIWRLRGAAPATRAEEPGPLPAGV